MLFSIFSVNLCIFGIHVSFPRSVCFIINSKLFYLEAYLDEVKHERLLDLPQSFVCETLPATKRHTVIRELSTINGGYRGRRDRGQVDRQGQLIGGDR